MHVAIYHLSPYERCWQLELAQSLMAANYSVALEITDFELQYSPSCLIDKLSVFCRGGTISKTPILSPAACHRASSAIINISCAAYCVS